MLEQTSKIDIPKTTPKSLNSKDFKPQKAIYTDEIKEGDFKSALEKSLAQQIQSPKSTQSPQTPKDSKATSLPNVKSNVLSPLKPALESNPIKTPATNKASPIDEKLESLSGNVADTKLDSKPAGTPSLPASQLQARAQSPFVAQNTQAQNNGADIDFGKESQMLASPKNTPKNLNEMAKAKPQETFLSKITQNQAQNQKASDTKADVKEAKDEGDEVLDSKDFSSLGELSNQNDKMLESKTHTPQMVQNIAMPPLDSMQDIQGTQETIKIPNKASMPQNPANITNSKNAQTNLGANQNAKKISDVIAKGEELELNPSNVRFEEVDSDEFKNAAQNRATSMARALNANPAGDIKPFFDKQDEQVLRPLFYMLQTMNAKEAAQRRKSNPTNKVEYILEGKSERIAVIHRGKDLPKNITDSRIKNDRQDKVFEQIQKDLLAGKELDFEKITKDLGFLDTLNESSEPKIKPIKLDSSAPKDLSKGTANALSSSLETSAAAITTKASAQGGKEDSSKKDKGSNDKSSENPKNIAKASIESSSTDSLKDELKLADLKDAQFVQEEQAEALPEGIKQSQVGSKTKEVESKSEAKAEAKATTLASSANTLKVDSKSTNINPKETISSFVGQFGEEVRKYKPPFSRISLELSPKELGNIELTITQKGKNLHISVVSNPQAINVFAQNQADLRQSLVAAGFDGVNLSFSSNGNNGGAREQNQDSNQSNTDKIKQYEEVAQSSYDSMEIVLPQYA